MHFFKLVSYNFLGIYQGGHMLSARKKSYFRRQILLASIIIGIIAAVAVYLACSFGKCPNYPDRTQMAILFFFVVSGFSYAIKMAFFSKLR